VKVAGPTKLVLERADGSQRSIHPLWLRERCKDPASIDLQTQQRLQELATSISMDRAVSIACCAAAAVYHPM
jgi:hypothetical protein